MSRQSEWRKLTEERKHEYDAKRLNTLRIMSMAEVPASVLARGEEWRLFQQTIQGVIEKADAELSELQRGIMAPNVLSHDDLMAVKINGVILSESINALKAVLELPKKIQQDAKAAKEWVEREEWRKQEQ